MMFRRAVRPDVGALDSGTRANSTAPTQRIAPTYPIDGIASNTAACGNPVTARCAKWGGLPIKHTTCSPMGFWQVRCRSGSRSSA